MTPMKKTLAAFAIASLPLLTACGGSDSTPPEASPSASSSPSDEATPSEDAAEASSYADTPVDEIQNDALAAMKELKSVRLEGNVVMDGKQSQITIALGDGSSCEVTLAGQGAGEAILLQDGERTFIKGDKEFWTSTTGSPELADQVLSITGDKFALAPAGTGAGTEEFCNIEALTSNLSNNSGPAGEVVGEETVNGVASVKIDGRGTTVWVASEAPHYVVKLASAEDGEFNFSDFNEPVDVAVPGAGEFVDLSSAG